MGRRSTRLHHRVGRAVAALAVASAGLTGAVVAMGVQPAGAQDFPVTNTTDTGTDTLRDVLENQVSDGDTVTLVAGATYVLDDCKSGDIEIDAAVTIDGNGATIEQTCNDGVLYTDDPLTVNFVTITGGVAFDGGGGIYANSGDLSIYGSSIVGNFACSNGGGIHVHDDTVIAYSTISGNTTTDDGGAIANDGEGDISVFNSTITNNTGGEVGGIENDAGDTFLVYTTLVDNTTDPTTVCPDSVESAGHPSVHEHATDAAPQDEQVPANIRVDSTQALHTFASVIALPNGGTNCGDFSGDPLVNTDSAGYNFADDTSCDLTDTGDSQVPAADAKLGALGANGGPTLTMLPQTGSPLVNAIPLASCSPADETLSIKDDQRFLVRPDVVNQKCDIGAVEVQTEAPPVIQPTFTG